MTRFEEKKEVKQLDWLIQNGNTKEDREYAKKIYKSTLIELYARHVAKTGETYYPPMQEEIIEEYILNKDAKYL
tara:strand:+ start:388 stop:609 length:222 start_codon:yes stop_codon:yes gene_type:complete